MDINCAICNKQFSKLNKNQKYCSKECSNKAALGLAQIHNKIYANKHIGVCKNCGTTKPIIYNNHTLCNACYGRNKYLYGIDNRKEQANIYNKKIKELAIQSYGEKKCSVCGLTNLPNECYDFHHKDSETKEFSIGSLKHSMLNIGLINQEVSKCILLCANCHRIVHTKEHKDKLKEMV